MIPMMMRLSSVTAMAVLVIALASAAGRAHAQSSTPREETWVTNGPVWAIVRTTDTVYIGGDFSYVGPSKGSGGQTRNCIAALDAATGAATDWNPNAGGVRALAVSGTTVYVGGSFTTIGGKTRNHIAALDAATGAATSWNPTASHPVYTLAVSGTTVYAGGEFVTIGGQPRSYIAAFNTTRSAATVWNPNASWMVAALAVSGSTVYAGGGFMTIGGKTRNYIAALDAATGQATDWNPNANSWVYAIVRTYMGGDFTYAGGAFTTIGGKTRNRIAALDTATGTATSWDPDANNDVCALAVSPDGNTVYAGGEFTWISGEPRSRIAALNATTGAVTAWDPDANSDSGVYALAVSPDGNTVYAGGRFTRIGGKIRNYFAQFDREGTPTPTATPVPTPSPTPSPTVNPSPSATPSPTPSPTPTSEKIERYLLGRDSDPTGLDLNGDGKIDIADLIFLLNTASPSAKSRVWP